MIVIITVFPIIVWPCLKGLKYANDDIQYLAAEL